MRKKLKIRVKRSLESWEIKNLYGEEEDRLTKESMDNLPQLDKNEEYEQP